jgi:hypothetical protein
MAGYAVGRESTKARATGTLRFRVGDRRRKQGVKPMSRELRFFCTDADVVRSLSELDEKEQLRYFPTVSIAPDPEPARTLTAALSLGFAQYPRIVLVARRGSEVRPRQVEPSARSPWYAFDLLQNSEAGILHLGTRNGALLTPGNFSILGRSSEALSLFKAMFRSFQKTCRRVKSYWVGSDALGLLRSGGRLAASETASRTYDLRED